jgi:cellulose synthase/poly-beta-1,6-N-acetylglucosamine synthase-like glycosyltransferase
MMTHTSNLDERKPHESSSFAIAIPCFNEEQNIGRLLDLLGSGWDIEYSPEKIAVFSSECWDKTEEIVRAFALKSEIPVCLKSEDKRSGKCHAINRLIEMVGKVDIIVLVSGDVQISSANVRRILKHFIEKNVGVAGGRPVQGGKNMNLAYRVSKVMWDIHHLMVLRHPKTTEVTVFRNTGFRLDEKSLVDEAEIEWNISRRRLEIRYCPEAMIKTRAHQNMVDYIKQRTRVILGHCILARQKKYTVGSMKTGVRLKALTRYLASAKLDYIAFAFFLAAEAWIWLAAHFLVAKGRKVDGRWPRIGSAKNKFE